MTRQARFETFRYRAQTPCLGQLPGVMQWPCMTQQPRAIKPTPSFAARSPHRLVVLFCLCASLCAASPCVVAPFGAFAQEAKTQDAKTLDAKPSHWAFQKLSPVPLPAVRESQSVRTPIDRFLLARLEASGHSFASSAEPATWLRRATLTLTGLPPRPDELDAFLAHQGPDAEARAVDLLLASPAYGERWGKHWLDTAGYADSNGYFNADTDRPLAYVYRDYVIRAFNADVPFDRFVREQLAGDELSDLPADADLAMLPPERAAEVRDLLAATHYLRNAQDGTGESDGNPDEVTVDRATVLEGAMQIAANSLLGLTLQCARCHEHKFEPIGHDEYYRFQAIFYPTFPAFHPDRWVKPQGRVKVVASADETARWKDAMQRLEQDIAARRGELAEWVRMHRVAGRTEFADHFDSVEAKETLANWSNTAPGDDAPAGSPAVQLNAPNGPAAAVQDGRLQIIESGGAGDRWLCTRRTFDWTPAAKDAWIQVSFDLIQDRVNGAGNPAERIAFCLALHDFNDNGGTGGNILIDGNPAGGAVVYVDYPGSDSRQAGAIGVSGYKPGRNYGARVTNIGDDKFRVEQIVDGIAEDKSITLSASDLPDGAFGFEYCCGRSFVVDNVLIETSEATGAQAEALAAFTKELGARRARLDQEVKSLESRRAAQPGRMAPALELMSPPDIYRLVRGQYGQHGERVAPGVFRALADEGHEFAPHPRQGSSGRRLALADWLTRPGTPASSLVGRVFVNRIWQHQFGTGLVDTPDNFGRSGARPSHPELLDYLAGQFQRCGWSVKELQRTIVLSYAFRQDTVNESAERGSRGTTAETVSSVPPVDLDRALARYPLRRLDAESIRDGMLLVTGELVSRLSGPYVPTSRQGDGNVIVDEGQAGSRRRSVYLQQRRSQVASWLSLFDAPVIVTNCSQRPKSTVPLQSLALLNSDFIRRRAQSLASRLNADADEALGKTTAESARQELKLRLAMQRIASRLPTDDERAAAEAFLDRQRNVYAGQGDAASKAWTDLCQMLLASNPFLYIE